ncbi:TlpA disulfide reductase family protein [Pedobacter sp.]|uniref:TlpA family protein disulfide reductase n=1 Tax=Pedobacter sp. TaxID=1411316 RepID=UPI0031DC518A
MKKLTLLILFLSLANVGFSQYTVSQHVTNFNGFQRTNENDPDSALFFLRNLATLEPHSTDDLLHNSFAQSFLIFSETKLFANSEFLAALKSQNVTIDSARRKFKERRQSAYTILGQIKNDPNTEIKANAYPISLWVDAQDNLTNSTKLKAIGNEYLRYLNSTTDFYSQRKARYGLLIYNLMAAHQELIPAADNLLNVIYENLRDHQPLQSTVGTLHDEKNARAWYRYMFAYTNYVLAQKKQVKTKDHLTLLKTAAQFSPDNTDKTVSSAYFYDMIFLFGERKPSFEEDYLAALETDDQKFKMLLSMSFNDPSFKAKAKSLYKDSANFDTYWLGEFNKTLKTAPLFSLRQISGEQYTLANSKNTWTLIDFWGTWCGPCRKEHPDLQKLFQKTKDGKIKNLDIITIASRDQEPAVRDYLKEYHYDFPVAMSDNQLEESYNVSSWPSKFLVSPQGKFIIIPFNVDWQKYIEDYID